MKIKESPVYTIVFTFIITFVLVFALAYANHQTRDLVKKNEELFQIKAILQSMQIESTNSEQAYQLFQEQVRKLVVTQGNLTNQSIYVWGQGEQQVYAMIFSGDALWGSITGVLTVNAAVDRIIGLSFIEQNETPGLGARITEEWFLGQFAGELTLNTNAQDQLWRGITMKLGRSDRMGDPDKSNREVDGISGASITSVSVAKAVNKTLPVLYQLIQGVKNEQ